jgi:ribonuclease Z
VKPLRLLIDVGENVSSALGAMIFAVEYIYISHSHLDHLSGLPAFLGHRRSTKGDNAKPLTIITPTTELRDRAKAFMDLTFDGREPGYEIKFEVLPIGISKQIKGGYYIEPFKTKHCPGSAGLMVYTVSRRLKPIFRNSPKFKAAVAAREKRVTPQHLEDHYDPKLVYALDNIGFSFEKNTFVPVGVDLLIDDLTFPFGFEDEEHPKHNDCAHLAHNLQTLRPKQILATHVSSRYMGEQEKRGKSLNRAVMKQLRETGLLPDSYNPVLTVYNPRRFDTPLTYTLQF